MKVDRHRRFKKKYKKLNKKMKSRVKERARLFAEDPSNPQLKNHPLRGESSGLYSFAVTGDYRIIYYIENDVAVFTDIGTHNQVYRVVKDDKLSL